MTVVSKEPLPPSHSCSTRITRLYCRGRVSVSMAVCTVSGVTAITVRASPPEALVSSACPGELPSSGSVIWEERRRLLLNIRIRTITTRTIKPAVIRFSFRFSISALDVYKRQSIAPQN